MKCGCVFCAWVNSIPLCSIWLELCPNLTFRPVMSRTPNSWQPADSDKYTDRDICDRTCMFCCLTLTWTEEALPILPRYKLSSAEDSRQSPALCVWQQKYNGRCLRCVSVYTAPILLTLQHTNSPCLLLLHLHLLHNQAPLPTIWETLIMLIC